MSSGHQIATTIAGTWMFYSILIGHLTWRIEVLANDTPPWPTHMTITKGR